MDAIRPRLHPLLTAAAISVTVFSAAGVAALTGLLPHSLGSSKEAEPVVAASTPAMPAAAPQATPVVKPKPARRAAKPQPTQPVHNATKRWDVTVRMDDGAYHTLSSPSLPYWHAGDRVRFLDGKLQPV